MTRITIGFLALLLTIWASETRTVNSKLPSSGIGDSTAGVVVDDGVPF